MLFEEKEYDNLVKYVKTIMELNKDSDTFAYEILITPAGYDSVLNVEVLQYNTEHDEQDHFRLVESDQELMREYNFPDGHYEYFHSAEEFKEALDDFLTDEASEGRHWTRDSLYGIHWQLEETKINK